MGEAATFFLAIGGTPVSDQQVVRCDMSNAQKEPSGGHLLFTPMYTFAIDTGIFVAGAFLGVLVMCLLQVSRSDE